MCVHLIIACISKIIDYFLYIKYIFEYTFIELYYLVQHKKKKLE